MPTLRFHDRFDATERRILTRTFRQNCRDLGITNRDASIDVRKVKLNRKHSLGAITHPAPGLFIMILNRENDLMRSIFALGHEMVHFDQHTRGDMRDDPVTQTTFWKGEAFPAWLTRSPEHYERLPWEIEAHAKQDALMDNAMRCLPLDERRFVCDNAIADAA